MLVITTLKGKIMGDIVDINSNEPHKVSEVICAACRYRWIAVRPVEVKLKQLECSNCKRVGFVIETGEVIEDTHPERKKNA